MRSGLEIEAHHPMRMTLSGPTWPYVSLYRSASFGSKIAERSFFRQPGLAQAFQPGRYVCSMLSVPFEGEAGINAPGFHQGGLRLVHLAFERIRRSQTCVYPGDHDNRRRIPSGIRRSRLRYPTNSDGKNPFIVAASLIDSAAGKNAVVSN